MRWVVVTFNNRSDRKLTPRYQAHPIRVQARLMKQKADHHLSFLPERIETASQPFLPVLPPGAVVNGESSSPARRLAVSTSIVPPRPSPLRDISAAPDVSRGVTAAADVEEEDAAGEADDVGPSREGHQSFRGEAGAGPQSSTATERQEGEGSQAGQSAFIPAQAVEMAGSSTDIHCSQKAAAPAKAPGAKKQVQGKSTEGRTGSLGA